MNHSYEIPKALPESAANVVTEAKGGQRMKTKDFTTSFTVDQSPGEVFGAVNNVRGWWAEEIDGSTDKLGAEFKFHHKDFHRSTQKITALAPGKKVAWHVVDSHLNFVKDKTEWKGTDIVFEITRKDDKTELRFTHVGLVPALECYGDCSGGWSFYINDSLRSLITTGKGQPNPKEKGGRGKRYQDRYRELKPHRPKRVGSRATEVA
jgi:hypothetical protein